MKYTRHVVSSMSDQYVQRCILCGTVITDYSHCMFPPGQEPPLGFTPGIIYVSEPVDMGGNAITRLSRTEFLTTAPEGEEIEDCK